MSKYSKGDPKIRTGHVVVVPPGKSMPPVKGFTPFWEKELGLLYVTNRDVQKVDLSIGKSIQFEVRSVNSPGKIIVTIACNITNI